MQMTCTEQDCDGKAVARGLCGKHYKAWQVAGRPEGPALMGREVIPCSVATCITRAYAKGMCARHYKQVQRTGEVLEDKAPRLCSVDGCDRTAASRGWCHGHYLRWTRTGDVQADVPLGRSGRTCCSVPGCARPTASLGLCEAHRQRVLTSGEERPDEPLRTVRGEGFAHHGYRSVPVPAEERWLTDGRSPAAEHRLVMARSLGRPLRPDESVHHRNGQRGDNRLENLELWSRYQPIGARVADQVAWAVEILTIYAPEALSSAADPLGDA